MNRISRNFSCSIFCKIWFFEKIAVFAQFCTFCDFSQLSAWEISWKFFWLFFGSFVLDCGIFRKIYRLNLENEVRTFIGFSKWIFAFTSEISRRHAAQIFWFSKNCSPWSADVSVKLWCTFESFSSRTARFSKKDTLNIS